MISLLAFLFVIGILVFIHELGHFSVAKLCGVRVEKFSLGFGKKIFGFIKGETEYLISLLPLGGYVKMYGEGNENNVIIDRVDVNSQAYKNGFRSGDRIVKIDNLDIPSYSGWEKILNHLNVTPDMERSFKVERDGETLGITTNPEGLEGLTAFTENEYKRGFSNQSIINRFFIIVAGPMMNFLLPFIFLPIVFMMGISVPAHLEQEPVVGYVSEGSKADEAGFMVGDRIISINGSETDDWRDVNITLQSNPDSVVNVVVERNGEAHTLDLLAEASQEGLVAVGLSEPLEARVGGTIEGSPASKAGLETGDMITRINGTSVENWEHMASIIQKNAGNELDIDVKRNGSTMNFTLIPEVNPQTGEGAIGITLYREQIVKQYGFFDSIINGFKEAASMVYEVTVLLLGFLFKLLTGQISLGTAGKSIAGPLFIAKISGSAAQSGIPQLLQFTSFISINLAVINLLPIPMLDGGHVLYLLIETVKRKPLNRKTMEIVQRFGFTLLILIMFLAIYNDISRLSGDIFQQLSRLLSVFQ